MTSTQSQLSTSLTHSPFIILFKVVSSVMQIYTREFHWDWIMTVFSSDSSKRSTALVSLYDERKLKEIYQTCPDAARFHWAIERWKSLSCESASLSSFWSLTRRINSTVWTHLNSALNPCIRFLIMVLILQLYEGCDQNLLPPHSNRHFSQQPGHENKGNDHQTWDVLIFNQILWTSGIRHRRRPVKRICMLMPLVIPDSLGSS